MIAPTALLLAAFVLGLAAGRDPTYGTFDRKALLTTAVFAALIGIGLTIDLPASYIGLATFTGFGIQAATRWIRDRRHPPPNAPPP